jgi:predicted metalloprotease with PDZ domain
MKPSVLYSVALDDPAAHTLSVTMRFTASDPQGEVLMMPAWIPGSYMIREFARHVSHMTASARGKPLALRKVDKHSWRLTPASGVVEVQYKVYAWDLSVRAAHFDDSHCFFNPSVVCLLVCSKRAMPVHLDVSFAQSLPARWQIATTMPRRGPSRGRSHRFQADDYDTFIDHPLECGEFELLRFEAQGIVHELALTGVQDAHGARLTKDLQAICAEQIKLFGTPAPFERYLFLTTVTADAYGGLEHRSSTALLAARSSLPSQAFAFSAESLPEAYRGFLGLASHEYFHSWNVKRIMPAAFKPYDFTCENYTRLLWIFEGFTSYYDDLMLRRASVITAQEYLQCLEATINQVLAAPGRLVHSVSDASLEAWIKYYRQDENSSNTQVSYYAKGALVALCLDLNLRKRSSGQVSLDDVMRYLWKHFGAIEGPGVPEEGFARLVREATGFDLSKPLREWTETTAELPLQTLLASHGVALTFQKPNAFTAQCGLKLVQKGSELQVTQVLQGSPAHAAGLSAGDVLVALNGLRIDEKGVEAWAKRQGPTWSAQLTGFRRDELRHWRLNPRPFALQRASLAFDTSANTRRSAARKLGEAWLGA